MIRFTLLSVLLFNFSFLIAETINIEFENDTVYVDTKQIEGVAESILVMNETNILNHVNEISDIQDSTLSLSLGLLLGGVKETANQISDQVFFPNYGLSLDLGFSNFYYLNLSYELSEKSDKTDKFYSSTEKSSLLRFTPYLSSSLNNSLYFEYGLSFGRLQGEFETKIKGINAKFKEKNDYLQLSIMLGVKETFNKNFSVAARGFVGHTFDYKSHNPIGAALQLSLRYTFTL